MSWWSETLKRWAHALHIEYDIDHVPHSDMEQVGQWGKVDGHWTYQVDEHHVIHFSGLDATPELRQALGWTLQHTRETAASGSRSQLDAVYDELIATDILQLSRALIESRDNYIPAARRWAYPGYLLLVQRAASGHRFEDVKDSWKQVIKDVLPAIVPKAWHQHVGMNKDVLIYASLTDLEDSFLDLPDESDPPHPMNQLAQLGSLLATAIAEDAFIDARVLVSKRVESPKDIYGALVSAIIAGQVEWGNKANSAVFGNAPLPMFLRLCEENSLIVFWQSLMEKSTTPLEDWPNDWTEMVQGVVSANLNISEAARLLYVHRNTLLNKIERLYQVTGHDVRRVSDAAVLYLASILTRQQIAQEDK